MSLYQTTVQQSSPWLEIPFDLLRHQQAFCFHQIFFLYKTQVPKTQVCSLKTDYKFTRILVIKSYLHHTNPRYTYLKHPFKILAQTEKNQPSYFLNIQDYTLKNLKSQLQQTTSLKPKTMANQLLEFKIHG